MFYSMKSAEKENIIRIMNLILSKCKFLLKYEFDEF